MHTVGQTKFTDFHFFQNALFLRQYPAPTPADEVLVTAATASGIMLVMAFRGFIIWIINVTLVVYMFTQTFTIYDYNQFRRKVNYVYIYLGMVLAGTIVS